MPPRIVKSNLGDPSMKGKKKKGAAVSLAEFPTTDSASLSQKKSATRGGEKKGHDNAGDDYTNATVIIAAMKQVNVMATIQSYVGRKETPPNNTDIIISNSITTDIRDVQYTVNKSTDINAVAAAGTTTQYAAKYGVDEHNYNNNEDDDPVESEDVNYNNNDNKDEEDEYLDDSAEEMDEDYNNTLYDDEIEGIEEEDLNYYRNDSGKSGCPPIPGGPKRPDVSDMSETAGKEVIKQYIKDRRKYTDECKAKNKIPNEIDDLDWSHYSGDCCELLRPMTCVEESPMKRGDTYPSKEICLIRIGEQSNLFNGDILIKKSDNERIIAKSRHNSLFTIRVVKSDNYGWKVTVYNVTYAHAEIAKIDDEVIIVEEGSH